MTVLQWPLVRLCASAAAVIGLAQCGTNPEAAKFFDANNTARIVVPNTTTIDLAALDCAANQHAIENDFSYFARTDGVTMRVVGGFAQSPAILTNADGEKGVLAVYGFYRSEADWNAAKDDRILSLNSVGDFASQCP